mmetsp:Transcript_9888/g.28537  ORF Transcript_9888/g.28537 Transcript_9888/m.28537 type:complete len:233 (-) Transcript_9888:203-901(-)
MENHLRPLDRILLVLDVTSRSCTESHRLSHTLAVATRFCSSPTNNFYSLGRISTCYTPLSALCTNRSTPATSLFYFSHHYRRINPQARALDPNILSFLSCDIRRTSLWFRRLAPGATARRLILVSRKTHLRTSPSRVHEYCDDDYFQPSSLPSRAPFSAPPPPTSSPPLLSKLSPFPLSPSTAPTLLFLSPVFSAVRSLILCGTRLSSRCRRDAIHLCCDARARCLVQTFPD